MRNSSSISSHGALSSDSAPSSMLSQNNDLNIFGQVPSIVNPLIRDVVTTNISAIQPVVNSRSISSQEVLSYDSASGKRS